MNKDIILGCTILAAIAAYTAHLVANEKGDASIVFISQTAKTATPSSVNVSSDPATSNDIKPKGEAPNYSLASGNQAHAWSHPLLADVSRQGVPEQILVRDGYTVSYNKSTRCPNYVAWTLCPERLEGKQKREPAFYEDPDLDNDSRAWLRDYYNSGFDRGHLCPAGDCKYSKRAMAQTFYLSNICPQTHTLNAGDWNSLESATRRWAKQQEETIHIIAGPIYVGTGQRRLHKRVRVPDKFFKVLLCLDKGKEKGIAFVMNNNTENHDLNYYATTIDEVERQTGYDFFPTVTRKLQDRLESQRYISAWSRRMNVN